MNFIQCIVVGATIVISLIIFLCGFKTSTINYDKTDFLRIHIRANSNSSIDQNVKYKVKGKVVEFLTPKLVDAVDKKTAMKIINDNISNIENVANAVLSEYGFKYRTKAQVKKENFPTRQYDDLVLQSGVYDALILNLGSGSGNNWWCVVYPPLCFVGSEDDGKNSIQYRSKILDIINKFFK